MILPHYLNRMPLVAEKPHIFRKRIYVLGMTSAIDTDGKEKYIMLEIIIILISF